MLHRRKADWFLTARVFAGAEIARCFTHMGVESIEREVTFLNSKIKDDSVDFLFQAILSLKTVEECYNFFEDLCTVPEIKAMSQRLLVAHMLSTKRVYSDIVARTGASTATISRVNRSLNYGCDGYELVFSRLDHKNEEKETDK